MRTGLSPPRRGHFFSLSLWIGLYIFSSTHCYPVAVGTPLRTNKYLSRDVISQTGHVPLYMAHNGTLRCFRFRRNVREERPQHTNSKLAFLNHLKSMNRTDEFGNFILRHKRGECRGFKTFSGANCNTRVRRAKFQISSTQRYGDPDGNNEHEFSSRIHREFDLQRAMQLIEETMPASRDSSEGNEVSGNTKTAPMTVLYNCLLHGCERQEDILGAIEMYQHMRRNKVKPDMATFRSLAALLERSGHFAAFNQLLDHMLEAGLKPSLPILSLGISCYCKAGAVSDALVLAQRLKEYLYELNIASPQTEVPPIDVATPSGSIPPILDASFTALAQAMPAVVFADLITCCARTGWHEEALAFYEQLLKLASHQDKLQHFLSLKNMPLEVMSSEMRQLHQALTPQTEHYAAQLLARNDFQPSVACSNAALASAAATGRLRVSLRIFGFMLEFQKRRCSTSLPTDCRNGSGECLLVESSSPTTETFLLMLQAAGFQGSAEAVRFIVRHFEHQQYQRRSMQLPSLDETRFWAEVSKSLALSGWCSEAVGMLVRGHSLCYAHPREADMPDKFAESSDTTCAISKDINVALGLQNSAMLSIEPYMAVLRACADAGAAREALGVLRLLQQRHQSQRTVRQFSGNGVEDSFALREEFPLSAFEEVLRAADKASDWEMVLAVASEFESFMTQDHKSISSSTPRTEKHLDGKGNMPGPSVLSALADCNRVPSRHVGATSNIHLWSSPIFIRIRVRAFKLIALLKLERLSAAQKDLQELYRLLEQERSLVDSLRNSVTPDLRDGAVNSGDRNAPVWEPQIHNGVVRDALALASLVLGHRDPMPSHSV